MENQSAVLIPLLTDATINTAGGEVVVVGPALNFMHRAISVQAFLDVYEISGTGASVVVDFDWSIDKVNWTRIGAIHTAVTAVGMVAGTPYSSNANFGPFVRFVVKFTTSSGAGLVNASIVLNVRFFG